MVSGHYVNKFSEASHILFDGNLDSQSFRRIAIQQIKDIQNSNIIASVSGELAIKNTGEKEYVELSYRDFYCGLIKTKGYPFKDVTNNY